MAEIQLVNQTSAALIAALAAAGRQVACVVADPPWKYRGGATDPQRGLAARQYPGMPDAAIADDIAAAAVLLAPDSYLFLWCTFPKLGEWMAQAARLDAVGLRYLTGGAWGKIGQLGVGYHFRGDAELLLVYGKGQPKARTHGQSNLWMFEVGPTGLWLAQREGHSRKPQAIWQDLLRLGTDPGVCVLDLYAGDAATMARACRATGRAYIGAEADAARWQDALTALSQQEAFNEEQESQAAQSTWLGGWDTPEKEAPDEPG